MTRFRSALALAVVALGLAGPAAAGDPVPFKGALEGDVTRTPVPPLIQVDIDAAGRATHLGRFALEVPHLVDPVTRTAAGQYRFTAADGDTLTADFIGLATPLAGGLIYVEETATITGGTGRFANATGSFVVTRLFDPVAGTTVGSFEGTISKR